MNKREKAAREKLKQYEVHTDKKGGRPVTDWETHVHKETKLRSIRDTLRTLRGK